jgi:hypothetical protein
MSDTTRNFSITVITPATGWTYVPNWDNKSYWYKQSTMACVAVAGATSWSIYNNRRISTSIDITTKTLFEYCFTSGPNSASAVWTNLNQITLSSEQAVLNYVRDRILDGMPVVLRVSDTNRTKGHSLTAVGVNRASIGRNVTRSDIIIINPSNGTSSNLGDYLKNSKEYTFVNWNKDNWSSGTTMTPKTIAQSKMRDSSGKVVTAKCPVDINIYALPSNTLVVSIVNEEIIVNTLGASVMNGEKAVFLPDGEEYRIEIIPYGNGPMYYSITEYDDNLEAARKIQFEDIQVNSNMVLSGSISENCGVSLLNYALSIDEDGIGVRTQEAVGEYTGGDISNYVITVNPGENGSCYYEGTFEATYGDVIELEAIPDDGAAFAGWYENGAVVSSSAKYRFKVEGNRVLTLKYTAPTIPPTYPTYPSGGAGSTTQPAQPSNNFSDSNRTYTQGSNSGLVHITQKDFSLFSGVQVDKNALTKDKDFKAESGSTKITLLPGYLNMLTVGKHTLTVSFKDGVSVAADFAVEAEAVILEESEPKPWVNPFTDLNDSNWFYNAVAYVYQNDLMTGTSINPMTFSPNGTLTRGMVVTVLCRISGSPDVTGLKNQFDDVADGKWYTEAVIWAYHNGVVSGYGDGKYGPEDYITRQDLAVILDRYADKTGVLLPAARGYALFNDDADIANYAKEAVERFFRANIVNGKPGNLYDPKGSTTRAEFATMLMQFLETVDN